jgi:hypothetical protein
MIDAEMNRFMAYSSFADQTKEHVNLLTIGVQTKTRRRVPARS